MTECIFYLLILGFAAYGFKKGMPDSGMLFVKTGAATYFSIWLLPLLLPVFANLPPDASPYAFCGAAAALFIIIFAILQSAETKIIDSYPAYDSEPVFSALQLASSILGTVFGALAGYAAAAFVLMLLSFIPAELPMLTPDALAESSQKAALGFSRKVNLLASEEWNAKQEEVFSKLRSEYAKVSDFAPEENTEEKTTENAKDDKAGKQAEKAPAAEGNSTSAETESVQTASSLPLPQRIASKAVSSINNVSEQQMAELDDKKSAPPAKKKSPEAVTFEYIVKVLKPDGSESDYPRKLKLGINLPEDGKIPVMIDAEVPMPVLRDPKRTITRTLRIDLSLLELTRVKAIPEQKAVKYTIVDVE